MTSALGGQRQVANAKVALVTPGGFFFNSNAYILRAERLALRLGQWPDKTQRYNEVATGTRTERSVLRAGAIGLVHEDDALRSWHAYPRRNSAREVTE